MARIKKVNSTRSTPPPVILGNSTRPGQIEGGNTDPVIISGETEVKKMAITKPGEIVRAIAYRAETNEACILIDNHEAFNNVEPPLTGARYIPNQTKLMYYNGNSMVNADVVNNTTHYKFNDIAWRPMYPPSPQLDRWEQERLGTEGTQYGDVCLIVGESKVAGTSPLFLLRPALLGSNRGLGALSTSPIVAIVTTMVDFTRVELNGVCWKQTFFPSDSIQGRLSASPGGGVDSSYSGHLAFVVGGLDNANGTYTPKVYAALFTSNDVGSYPYIYDLAFDTSVPNASGVLYGCDFDDENNMLYVVGSRMTDGLTQVFAKYDLIRNTWTDLSNKCIEQVQALSSGNAFLAQDGNGIHLIKSNGEFISESVKRGQAVHVNLETWQETAGFTWNAGNTGMFSVQKVVSEQELILDKRMPNYDDIAGATTSSLFHWGFLNTAISATGTTIVVDVPQALLNDAGAAGISFPNTGGTVYIDGELITYTTSAYVDVVGPPNYRRYTLTGCVRGIGGTTPCRHFNQYSIFGNPSPNMDWIRTVVCLCEEWEYEIFTRFNDCKMSTNGMSVFISGDNGYFTRYDPGIQLITDYREKIAIPNTVDFGKMSWKPDSEACVVVANTYNNSSIYIYERGYFNHQVVPTGGIINDVSWTPDGMNALIGGKDVFKMTKKVNVELAEREPKSLPKRYLFFNQTFDALDANNIIDTQQSNALAIDDFDPDTLEIFIEASDFPVDPIDGQSPVNMLEFEVRIYLGARGDEIDTVRRNFWRAITVSDTVYTGNPTHYDDAVADDTVSTSTSRVWRKVFKLPSWAKYIAVDLVSRNKYTLCSPFVTVGIQGGQR